MIDSKGELDLGLLRTFAAVAKSGGFSSAGELLGCSQPAVSVQIKRLEKRVGSSLFRRGNRSIALTSAGQILLQYAQQILETHDEAIARLTSPTLGGFVRLGILEEIAPPRLAFILNSFIRVHSQVHLEVQIKPSAELLLEYRRGRLDLVFATGREASGEGIAVWQEPLVWVGDPGLKARARECVPLVVLPDPCAYRMAATTALVNARRRWEPVCTSSTMAGVRASVEAGIGITAVGKRDVGGALQPLGSDWALPKLANIAILLYQVSPRLSQPARHLADYLARAAV
jgi:DNA-binding transcriptional LysR family regulator